MDKKVLENYIKAGKILQSTQKKARKSIRPGQKLLDIALQIEKDIRAQQGEPAFPANLSANHYAAHYTPSAEDEAVVQESDVLKVDIGVHVDGYIADAAFTLDFSGKFAAMVEAAEAALKDALVLVKEGVEIGAIGAAVQKAINARGFNPIQNLTGHGLEQWNAHAQPGIANIKHADSRKLKEGVFAIEPFATDGRGFVKETPQSEIFALDEERPIRNVDARAIMKLITEKYHTLPFAERWIAEELGVSDFRRKVAMRELMQRGCIRAFPILREEPGKIVTQAETSVAIADGKAIVLV